jgi:hypothetical protein
MLRRVALVRTNVSEELSSCFIRVTRIGELGTTLVTASVVPSPPILATLIKEALSSSETSVVTRATLRNIPEDAIFHSLHRENLKPKRYSFSFLYAPDHQMLPSRTQLLDIGIYTRIESGNINSGAMGGLVLSHETAYCWLTLVLLWVITTFHSRWIFQGIYWCGRLLPGSARTRATCTYHYGTKHGVSSTIKCAKNLEAVGLRAWRQTQWIIAKCRIRINHYLT